MCFNTSITARSATSLFAKQKTSLYNVRSHIRSEGFGDSYRAVGILVVFQNCSGGSAYCNARTVEGMNEAGFLAFFASKPDSRSARLEVLEVRARRNLNISVVRRKPYFNIIGLCARKTEVARAKRDNSVRQTEQLKYTLCIFGQFFQFLIGIFGVGKFYKFNLIELMLANMSLPALPASALKQAE